MILINFSQKLNEMQLKQIEILAGEKVEVAYRLPVDFDNEADLVAQVEKGLDRLPITPDTYQTAHFIIQLPSSNLYTAVVLAVIRRRSGRLPRIITTRMLHSTSFLPQQDISTMIDLELL
jgi:hypothetical protein